MYGILNRSIMEMVVHRFGEEKWDEIREDSQVEAPSFFSNHHYEDRDTFAIADSAAKILDLPVEKVMFHFGVWWITEHAMKHYRQMVFQKGSLKDFLLRLPDLHSRIMLMYEGINPPEFKVGAVGENRLELHYQSVRKGLAPYFEGLIIGLAKIYQTKVSITRLASLSTQGSHEIYEVSWKH